MDYYMGEFKEMDDARRVYSKLKKIYNGKHTDIKLVNKTVKVPETARDSLEMLARRLHADFRLFCERKKKQ